MGKSLKELVEEANLRPVPYEGLFVLHEKGIASDDSSASEVDSGEEEDFKRALSAAKTELKSGR